MTLHWIVLAGQVMMASQAFAQAYCAQYSDGSSLDCGFTSLSQCEQSVTGVGGVCINDPSGPSAASAANGQSSFNVTSVPPPPFAQTSSGPYPPQDPGPISSLSSDLGIGGGDPPATLGAITFRQGHSACIGLFGASSCGG
jgi:hypothetical protein